MAQSLNMFCLATKTQVDKVKLDTILCYLG